MKLDHLLKLADKLEPKIGRLIRESIKSMANSVDLAKVERLLEAGQVELAVKTLEPHISRMADKLVNYTVVAGLETARLMEDRLNIVVSFDQTNSRAVSLLRTNKLRLVREFTDDQRLATQEALVQGTTEGINPKAQARLFRDSIGLTQNQQRAVLNYKRLLQTNSRAALDRALRDKRFDRSVLNAIESGKVLSNKEIDRMVDRYRQRFIKYRSEVISRTEALRSVHEGSEEMYSQAMDSGTIDSNSVMRTWVTAKDERVRGSHLAMNGQQRPIGQPFTSGNGYKLMYPGDPKAPASEVVQCRCRISTVFKEDP